MDGHTVAVLLAAIMTNVWAENSILLQFGEFSRSLAVGSGQRLIFMSAVCARSCQQQQAGDVRG